MKKFTLLSILIISQFSLFAGDGTQLSPYTVSQAISKADGSSQTHWVKGYVVGEMSQFSNNKYFYELAPPFSGTTAYLIADKPDEVNLAKCMPIQLETSREAALNLSDNPQCWRKEVLCCGLLRDYFALPGLKSLTSLEILSPAPLTDETTAWSFYEDMDGSYTPSSSTSIFAGGSYTGATGEWQLYGATIGESGNDNKWGKASARIRLSEASTGNPGYLQMNFDKPNGIGVVRFWAGYYGTDNNGAIAVQTSTNQGQSWNTAVAYQFIDKDWKEYQLTVNQPGNIRIRIMKAETGDAGINIDKIRVSDYDSQSSISTTTRPKITYTSSNGQIRINFGQFTQKARLTTLAGSEVWSATRIAGNAAIQLNKGVYLLQVDAASIKVVCR